ncbi:MAG: hypothetical protein MJY79_04365 [Bacteroidaceae bacterium]|nr:hypothetical protein [Bacteroidaceae bacterium]
MALKNDYQRIGSREQLEEALRDLKSEINAKGVKTKADYSHLKDFYTPANIYTRIMDGFTPVINLAAIAVDFYDRVRQRVTEMREE